MFDLLEAIKEQELEVNNKPSIEETAKVIDLIPFLNHCCTGLNTSSDEVKAKLLNAGNIQDIVNGDIPARTVKAHIKLWIVEGRQDISGNKE